FLGAWISPVQYATQYAVTRKIDDVKGAKMSRHIQIESYMSLAGSNADNRIRINASEAGATRARLYNQIASAKGASTVSAPDCRAELAGAIDGVAAELLKAGAEALVVCGTNNIGEQALVCGINHLLGNTGTT